VSDFFAGPTFPQSLPPIQAGDLKPAILTSISPTGVAAFDRKLKSGYKYSLNIFLAATRLRQVENMRLASRWSLAGEVGVDVRRANRRVITAKEVSCTLRSIKRSLLIPPCGYAS
jgi:hypothetical protein